MAYLQELIRPLAWYTVIRLVNKTNMRPGNAIFRHDFGGFVKPKFFSTIGVIDGEIVMLHIAQVTSQPPGWKSLDVILIVLSQSTTLCAQKSLDPGGYPRGNLEEVPLVIMKLIVSLKTLRWTVKCLTSFAHSVPVSTSTRRDWNDLFQSPQFC